MMETWQELKVTVKREGEELVSNLLIELGAQGVAIEDSMDYVGNVNRFGEIFPDVEQQEEIVVTAYYPETVDVAAVEADLQAVTTISSCCSTSGKISPKRSTLPT